MGEKKLSEGETELSSVHLIVYNAWNKKNLGRTGYTLLGNIAGQLA